MLGSDSLALSHTSVRKERFTQLLHEEHEKDDAARPGCPGIWLREFGITF